MSSQLMFDQRAISEYASVSRAISEGVEGIVNLAKEFHADVNSQNTNTVDEELDNALSYN